MKKVLTTTAVVIAMAGPSFAGGLDEPIETAPVIVPEEPTGGIGTGAIVAGAAALLLLAAAASGDDDDDDDTGDTIIVEE
jgi:hypothetical protein